jgi:protein SCO1
MLNAEVRKKVKSPKVIGLLIALLAVAAVVSAQPIRGPEPGDPSSAKPGILGRIGIDQRLNHHVPLELPFVDENGRDVKLGDYFGKRPVLLAMVYYECPMLCTQVLNGVTGALKTLNFDVGKEFDVVAVSINPQEGPGLAAQKKAAYVERYGRPQTAAGWHFLTGRDESIKALAAAVGFRYEYVEDIKQYAHGAGVEVLTPKGVIARYYYGIEYSPRDLRLGIIEAADERIGSPIDAALLLCFHYDPTTGKYGPTVLTLVRIGAVLTIVAFGAFLFVSLRRERTSRRQAVPSVNRT